MNKTKRGILYIVPTPIGNLEDITFRAIKILKKVELIAAEDTRKSSKLLSHFDISNRLISYHKFNERSRVEQILNILDQNKDVAVISDAGTPSISDPANIIIKEAIQENIRIEVLPGATAFIPALVASGFVDTHFFFAGFLAKKKIERESFLEKMKEFPYPMIFYESPHRVLSFLKVIRKYFGNRKVSIAREISKVYETYYRTNIDEILNKEIEIKLKGEFVIVIAGFEEQALSNEVIKFKLKEIIRQGVTRKTAIKQIVEETGAQKNRVYQIALEIDK